MKSHVRVAVIGGGVVGVSVLYHLTKLGWTDVALIERSELTSGSTWHAAGGMHAINGDTNMTALQAYTVRLYDELEKESGQVCGIHRVGFLYLAASETCMDYFRMERSRARHLKLDLDFASMEEVKKLNPLIDTSKFIGALYDPNDGHVDPSSVTNAYAKAAKARGADIYLRNPVLELKQTAKGGWLVVTKNGTIEADYVVNAGGLWAREVGRMAGVELPIVPMEHQYIVTNDIPAVAQLDREVAMCIDFDGESYLRQEGKGLLIGTYEHGCKHWAVGGTPQDFAHELLPNDVDRIWSALEVAMERYPCLADGGIKRIINGGMVFAPDGNPIIGPVRGLQNYFLACGVMAGFSQGGGVGLAVAQWIVDGEPGMDVFAMDVARYGEHVNAAYVLEKTTENYRRRFTITCPNEELPAARPLKTTPAYGAFAGAGAAFGALYGWEYPLWFAGEGRQAQEVPTFRRSEAFARVSEEAKAVREAVGLFESSCYAKFDVSGPGARVFLDRLTCNTLPKADGKTALAPLLTPKGQVFGDLTVTRLASDRYLMIGSPTAIVYYQRWFDRHRATDDVTIRDVTADWTGFSLTGPKARAVLAELVHDDISHLAFPFLSARRMKVGLADAIVIRVSFTGELGYEIYAAPEFQVHVLERLRAAGKAHGLRLCGMRALNALRLEKGYGSWGREYSVDYTPAEAGLERFVRLDKGDFIGRDAAKRILGEQPKRRLAIFALAEGEVDPMGNEPVLSEGAVVGRLTSGGFGFHVGHAIGLGYIRSDVASGASGLEIEILGERRAARILEQAPFDPDGKRLRM
jgi:dimethylglycine dehydrogenase